jgi:PilZ domain
MAETHPESERDFTSISDEIELTDKAERRAAPRHSCNVTTEGYELGPYGNNSWIAMVKNISAVGVALVVRHRIKPGTVLVIKLQSGNLHISRPLPVRVMNIHEYSEDSWLIGCAFVRKIREEDLQSLL